MKLITATFILLSVVLAACSKNDSIDVDKQQFEAYLKLKRIPLNDEERVKRMLGEYEKREALTIAIAKSDLLDTVMVDVEVEEFRRQLLITRYFEKYLADVVTDQGVQNFYSKNADTYKTRKVRVSHILFRVNPRMEETERNALLTTAHEAYSKITAGEEFAAVAKADSQDKVSGAKGGDLGWINEGAVAQEFSAKAFSMKAGEVSEPFLTAFGFHILKVVEEPQDIVKPLESVKGDIRYQLRFKSKKAERERLLESVGYAKAG